MRVLVADDEAESRTLLTEWLSRWGHQVVSAADIQAAGNLLTASDGPRLILLDWRMASLDGGGFCRRLRQAEPPDALYMLLLIHQGQERDMVHAVEAGADDFLTKPFDQDVLRARLQVGCHVLQLRDQLREQERLQGMLQLAGAVCHELNQPLQMVLSSSEVLLQELPRQDAPRELLLSIAEGVQRLGRITRRLMSITHTRTRDYLGEPNRISDLREPASLTTASPGQGG